MSYEDGGSQINHEIIRKKRDECNLVMSCKTVKHTCVFTVIQLCRGKGCVSNKETACGFSLSDDLSIVLLLPPGLFPPFTLFPLLLCFSSPCGRRN